jgi:hypothetical protein
VLVLVLVFIFKIQSIQQKIKLENSGQRAQKVGTPRTQLYGKHTTQHNAALTLSAFVNCNTNGNNSSMPPPPDEFPAVAGPAERE